MAIQKERINFTNGVATLYHKIGTATVRDENLACTLESYVAKDYRNGGRCAETVSYTFDITLEEEESMGIRQLAYTKIKALPEWEGAIDC